MYTKVLLGNLCIDIPSNQSRNLRLFVAWTTERLGPWGTSVYLTTWRKHETKTNVSCPRESNIEKVNSPFFRSIPSSARNQFLGWWRGYRTHIVYNSWRCTDRHECVNGHQLIKDVLFFPTGDLWGSSQQTTCTCCQDSQYKTTASWGWCSTFYCHHPSGGERSFLLLPCYR